MNLSALLAARAADGRTVRVGLIGAGKFGTMFLAQARFIPGVHVAAVADIAPERASMALALAGWPPLKAVARSLDQAIGAGATWVTGDALALFEGGSLDVVIETTGNARAGLRHALAAIAAGVSVIMVTVEADVLAGPLLARRAAEMGVVYSLAYGDQPAIICDMVDWVRTSGFEVACAGKGTKYLPGYNAATPETVWQHYGIGPERAKAAGMAPRRFTAIIDGTKSAIELAAVCNATGLQPPSNGLAFPPCGTHDLPRLLKPSFDGGRLEAMGQVEAVSSEERDGRHVVGDLRCGVFVTFKAPTLYAARCFSEYGLISDTSGDYAALWRPHHLMGMELGVSVAWVACLGRPTGCPSAFSADVVAVAKRDLESGTVLDGEGGYMVWGKVLPAAASLAQRAVPIGLTDGVTLRRAVASGQILTQADVAFDEADAALSLRRQMETEFG
ncbi:MAG: flagellar biosynthesis protein FlgA [Magnetospirillum sp.]|nr:flagellar biosynthesis protein FlgA [Magnetospirillum sp.]